MHKAPPPMPDTSKLKGCGLLTLAALAVPSALVVLILNLF